jgi:hypothetical protein
MLIALFPLFLALLALGLHWGEIEWNEAAGLLAIWLCSIALLVACHVTPLLLWAAAPTVLLSSYLVAKVLGIVNIQNPWHP